MTSPPAWIYQLYTPELASLFLERPPELARSEATRLARLLRLEPRARVFDQCCGIGALSIQLAHSDYQVIGVDLIPDYIQVAKSKALADGLESVDFYEGDASEFSPQECDAAFNWWTSFGHCGDEGDAKMIQRAFESLKSGGRFALDYMNVPQVLSEFIPTHALHKRVEDEPLTLIRETTVDAERGWMHKTWTYISPERPARSTTSQVKLYMPWEVKRMMESAGFVDIVCYGSLDGDPLTRLSTRLICVGRRP